MISKLRLLSLVLIGVLSGCHVDEDTIAEGNADINQTNVDASFGEAGTFRLSKDLTAGFDAEARTIARQSDGKLLVAGVIPQSGAGVVLVPGRSVPATRSFLARIDHDGRLDTSFGSGGAVVFDGNELFQPRRVALQRSGKILVVGSRVDTATNHELGAIYRFGADGVLDAAFAGGHVDMNLGCSPEKQCNAVPKALLVDTDDGFYVGAMTSAVGRGTDYRSVFALEHHAADGKLDTNFRSTLASQVRSTDTVDGVVGIFEHDSQLRVATQSFVFTLAKSGAILGRTRGLAGATLNAIAPTSDGIVAAFVSTIPGAPGTLHRLAPAAWEPTYQPTFDNAVNESNLPAVFERSAGRVIAVGSALDRPSLVGTRTQVTVSSIDAAGQAAGKVTVEGRAGTVKYADALLDGDRLLVIGTSVAGFGNRPTVWAFKM